MESAVRKSLVEGSTADLYTQVDKTWKLSCHGQKLGAAEND